MPLPLYRLRRWLAAIALLFIAAIAGVYFYARLRQRNVLKEVPNKLGIEIKQTAAGFQFSKSDGKRTLFTVQAGILKQFQLDGSAELHNVSIVLYGRDSSRFDQIYGDVFTYDKKSGDVTGRGEVQIDLEENPSGLTAADQSAPRELKNPIHLKTRNLVFNQNSGDASTAARVDFSTPQASGWAIGVHYTAKTNTLTLASQVHVTLGGANAGTLTAAHGIITRDPRLIVLDHPRMERPSGAVESAQATFYLNPDNSVQRVLATGTVTAESSDQDANRLQARADQAEMLLTGRQNRLHTAILTGNVHIERSGSQPMQGDAGRAVLDFIGENQLQKVHASDGVHLAQQAADKPPQPTKSDDSEQRQDLDVTAPVIDFFVADGKRLDHAETSGAAQITISPAKNTSPASAKAPAERTVITAGRFEAKFTPAPDGSSRLSSMHGAPDAKIVNTAPGIPNRISTSQTLDATFLAVGGISSIIQRGNVVYTDNQPPAKRTEAWAEEALYTPADRILKLSGSPRVSDGSMVTIANTIRINRATDDAFATGDVRTTYSELKEQPIGALLASASPIHVTAASMTAHNSPAIAVYQGNARLWQDTNVVEAPTIQFDRDRRSLHAQGDLKHLVSTVLVRAKAEPILPENSFSAGPTNLGKTADMIKDREKNAKPKSDAAPITITAPELTYTDDDRLADYEGGVKAQGTDFTASSKSMDAYLRPRSQTSSTHQLAGPGQLDHLVARGSVVIVQPDRRAEGEKLVYTASDDKFVLTGGPPSIFDAEQGKITGDSLTFFRADDRVLVEGEASTPVVTQTRARR